MGNSGVEKRLDTIGSKLDKNIDAIGAVVSTLGNLIARVGTVIKELRIANVHNEVMTGEKITKQDVQSNG